MCTHIVLENESGVLAARTMDFSLALDPDVVVFPRRVKMNFLYAENKEDHYAFATLAKNVGSYIAADGINEWGFSCASLYFDGFAEYQEVKEGKTNLASHEFVNWALTSVKSVDELLEKIENINVVGVEMDFIGRAAPLHWVAVDKTGKSVIIEPRGKGLEVHEDKLGVMTNSPDLQWHHTNIRSYAGLGYFPLEEKKMGGIDLKPFGFGSGSFGLPGDFTSPSRFIRAAYIKEGTMKGKTKEDLLIAASNILNGVSLQKGVAQKPDNRVDYTQYSSYFDFDNLAYYFKTYTQNRMSKVSLRDFDLDASEYIVFKINQELDILEIK